MARSAIPIAPTFEVAAPRIGLARTWPQWENGTSREICELLRLHQRAIASAMRLIYIENQYFSSYEIATAMECRMRQGGPPLEIVMVLPEKGAGLKERISIGVTKR